MGADSHSGLFSGNMTSRHTTAVSQFVQLRCAFAIGPKFAAVAIIAAERRRSVCDTPSKF